MKEKMDQMAAREVAVTAADTAAVDIIRHFYIRKKKQHTRFQVAFFRLFI
jgi:hypothetical protein